MVTQVNLRYPLPIHGTTLKNSAKLTLSKSPLGVVAFVVQSNESILVPWSNITSLSEIYENTPGTEGSSVAGSGETGESQNVPTSKPDKAIRSKNTLRKPSKAT